MLSVTSPDHPCSPPQGSSCPAWGPGPHSTPGGAESASLAMGPAGDACAGAVLVPWLSHILAVAVGQVLAVGSSPAIPREPPLHPHPSPREPAASCCTMARTMKNNSSKKDVRGRNAPNTPENLPDCFNTYSIRLF